MMNVKTVFFALAAVLFLGTPVQAQKTVTAPAKAKTTKAVKAKKAIKATKATDKKVAATPETKAKADTVPTKEFSRYMGVAQTHGLKQYLAMRLNVDTTDMTAFLRGLKDALYKPDDKDVNAYASGVQIGKQLMEQSIKNLSRLSDDPKVKILDEDVFKKSIIASLEKNVSNDEAKKAMDVAQKQLMFYNNRMLEKKFGKNREEGEKFLAENAKKEGVQTIPGSTVQYKVLKKGTGVIPNANSKVKVNYEGKLIDGTVFDSSYKRKEPAVFGCSQVIKGWTDALTHMPLGSIWEIYIPQDLAYGPQGSGKTIPPFATLIFKVELISIEK